MLENIKNKKINAIEADKEKSSETIKLPLRNRVGHLMALILAIIAVLFAVIGVAAGETFYFRLASEALIFSGLAMSVDILLGYAGLLSLGQALFFGLGAYTSALLFRDLQVGFWLVLIGSLLVATPVALFCGAIAIRAKGVYFVLITFGLAQVVAKAVYNIRELGASDGLMGVPLVKANFLLFDLNLSSAQTLFLLLLVVVLGVYFAIDYLMHLPFGRMLLAIRSNESRVPILGFNPQIYKIVAYVLAADVAALFGAFFPMLRGFVSPELLFLDVSINAVIASVIGGVGTLIGPVFGSLILTFVKSFVGSFTEHHTMVIGTLFVLSVIFFPKGLAGFLGSRGTVERKKKGDDDE